jgi:hypothetical protein
MLSASTFLTFHGMWKSQRVWGVVRRLLFPTPYPQHPTPSLDNLSIFLAKA